MTNERHIHHCCQQSAENAHRLTGFWNDKYELTVFIIQNGYAIYFSLIIKYMHSYKWAGMYFTIDDNSRNYQGFCSSSMNSLIVVTFSNLMCQQQVVPTTSCANLKRSQC